MTEYTYFVDLSSWFFIAFILSTFTGTAYSSFLDWINSEKPNLGGKVRKLHSFGSVAKKLFPLKSITKSLKYKQVNDRFSDMVDSIKSGISMIAVVFGLMPFTISVFHSLFPSLEMVWCWTFSLLLSSIASNVLFLPASLYNTFVIEERFGFNTTTKKTFYQDIIKSFVVGSMILVVIQLILNSLLQRFATSNILGIAVVVASLVAFGKILQWMFINWVMPMFNKFEPLSNKNLANKLMKLCKDCNFKVHRIDVMDASKRSKHSNAFICGSFGRKRIVLFDNLIENMSHDEILSIVGHEIGHGKLHHLMWKNIQAILQMTFAISITFVLMKCESFYTAFGYSWVNQSNINENLIIGFTLASMFMTSFMWIFIPLSNYISRKMEYAADRFSLEHTKNKKSLTTALLKLTADNLSDVFPHPLYEFTTYSHPSIINRIEALKKRNGKRH